MLFLQRKENVIQGSFFVTMGDVFQRNGSVTLMMTVAMAVMKRKNGVVVSQSVSSHSQHMFSALLYTYLCALVANTANNLDPDQTASLGPV